MNGYFLKDRIVFLQLKTLGCVLAVLSRDIARSTGHSAGLVFGAFEDYLHAISFSFLCHLLRILNILFQLNNPS